jgi:hypothetical protein
MVCARGRTHQRRDCASRSTISIALRSEHCGTVAAQVSSRSTISPGTSWSCAAATSFFLFRSKTGPKPDRMPSADTLLADVGVTIAGRLQPAMGFQPALCWSHHLQTVILKGRNRQPTLSFEPTRSSPAHASALRHPKTATSGAHRSPATGRLRLEDPAGTNASSCSPDHCSTRAGCSPARTRRG